MRTFLSAVSFLTVIPVGPTSAPLGRSAGWFPIVGAALGALGAALYLACGSVLPSSIASLIVVAFWTGISGVLHEDGLADVADALRAGRTREKMLAILKDSRIGTFGAVAIVLSVIARWQALENLATARIWEVLIASQAVPRAAIVALAWVSRPAGTGLGSAFSAKLTSGAAVIAIVLGAVSAMTCGVRPGIVIILGTYLAVRFAQMYFYRRIGGINGDCLGATEQVLEIFILVLFTCRGCAF